MLIFVVFLGACMGRTLFICCGKRQEAFDRDVDAFFDSAVLYRDLDCFVECPIEKKEWRKLL